MEKLTAYSTVALAVATVILAWFTGCLAWSTRRLANESREASLRQLRVQMWLEFQRRFDSVEMLNTRRKLAQLLKGDRRVSGKRVSETVLNFFEDLGTIYFEGLIHNKLAQDSFGFYLCRWWEAARNYVYEERRAHDDDDTLFCNFEMLARVIRLPDEKINAEELRQFLEDESRLESE